MFKMSLVGRAAMIALSIVATAGSAYAAVLAVTIGMGPNGQGFNASGQSRVWTFPSNLPTVTGGSGAYTYSWTNTNDGAGIGFRWSSGSGAAFQPVARASINCEVSSADYVVTVTDLQTHQTATSNVATYQYNYRNQSQICP